MYWEHPSLPWVTKKRWDFNVRENPSLPWVTKKRWDFDVWDRDPN